LRLLAPEVSLYHLAVRGAPVPYGNVQRGRHSVAKVARSIRFARGKMGRIDAVEIVERKRRKIRALRGCDLELCRLEAGSRGAYVRVPALRRLHELFKTD